MVKETDLFITYENIPLPVLVFDLSDRHLLFMNTSASGLFNKFKIIDVISVDDIFKYFNDYSSFEFFNALQTSKSGSIPSKLKFRSNNEERWFDVKYKKGILKEKEILIFALNDVTASTSTSFILEDVFRFRDMLYRIVEKNNSISTNEVPGLINESLHLIGDFFKCDRVYVCMVDKSGEKIFKVAEWFRNGVKGYGKEAITLSSEEVKWSIDKLFNGGQIIVNNINDLPEEAENERMLMLEWNVRSYIIAPINLNNGDNGYLGVDYVHKEKNWTEYDISNVKFVTRNIANLLLRYRNESYLREKEFLYQSLFKSANDSILIFENEICVDCSNKALELFRCEREDLIGLSGEELSVEEEKFSVKELKESLFKSKENTLFIDEYLVKRPDGTQFYSELSLSRILINETSYVIAIYRVISNIKRSYRELKNRESYLQSKLEQLLAPAKDIEHFNIRDLFDINQLQLLQDALVDSFGISSYISDEKGNPVTTPTAKNRICEMITSTEKGKKLCHETALLLRDKAIKKGGNEKISCITCGFIDAFSPIIVDGRYIGSWIIGQVIPDNYRKSDLKKYIGPLGVDVSKAEQMFDILPKFDDGKFKNILNLLSTLSNELSTLGYNNLKLARTIKEHIILENKLREAKNKAEESDRLKSAFLANMSHEIRTPMNGIVGFADLLDVEGLLPDERKGYVSLIKQSSQQLLNIINDIVDVSKIESGQVTVNKTRFSIEQMFDDLYLFFKRQIEGKNIDLVFDKSVSGELSDEIETDDIKLRQVLTNLLSNAIKFTEKGFVKFGYAIDQYNLICFVEDTGEGIGEKDLDNIFDRFWQSRQNRPGKGGTGLGLAISKAYVELLGGVIEVESELNKGTTFSVTIPLG